MKSKKVIELIIGFIFSLVVILSFLGIASPAVGVRTIFHWGFFLALIGFSILLVVGFELIRIGLKKD